MVSGELNEWQLSHETNDMIVLVSHFTDNRGTTDYFRGFLKEKKVQHYYLRHPFFFTNLTHSELIYFDGETEIVKGRYKKFRNPIIDLLRNFGVTLFVLLSIRNRAHKVFAFGSFNALPFIFAKFAFDAKIIFWGLDYSSERFSNFLLNKAYYISETLCCKYCDAIYQPSSRQEAIRMKNHGLKKEKSAVIPNGINILSFEKNFSRYEEIALLYIGSLTDRHGIVEFVESLYPNEIITFPLHIFGAGELEGRLVATIKDNHLEEKVFYYGTKSEKEIAEFLGGSKQRIFGIAPYSDASSDHVYYVDSLKIREYLNYNIPFIAPDFIFIDSELNSFGFQYGNNADLREFFRKGILSFYPNLSKSREVLKKYSWSNLFNEIDLS